VKEGTNITLKMFKACDAAAFLQYLHSLSDGRKAIISIFI